MNIPQATVTIFQATKVPPLPKPSIPLKQVLDTLHIGIPSKGKAKRGPKPKKKKRETQRRVINGFIAYRTFYSRSLQDATLQKELSRQLGKLWENEPDRKTWDCYASQYNATGGNDSFIDWLYLKLGLSSVHKSPLRKQTTRKQICRGYASRNVEDVFID